MPLNPNDPEDFVDVTLRDSVRTSIIRTVTPILVGFLALAFLRLGIKLNDATLATAVSGAIGSGYYSALRYLEPRFPWLGKLLGRAKPQIYDTVDGQLQTRLDQLAALIRTDSINQRALLLPPAFKAGMSYPDAAPLPLPPTPTVVGPLHDPINSDAILFPSAGRSTSDAVIFPATPKD